MSDVKLHRFQHDVSGIELPRQFTFPFHYVPHELCKIAAGEVMDYALNQDAWHDELMTGKMLGVLVVRDKDDLVGFLAAYSGNLGHTGENEYFVPHIYNLLEPDGLFRTGEAQISAINDEIAQLQASPRRASLVNYLQTAKEKFTEEESEMQSKMDAAKQERKRLRQSVLTPEQEQELIRESQFQKAEMRRLKNRNRERLQQLEQLLNDYDSVIVNLKHKRKTMSEELQRRLFELFVVNNAIGEQSNVADIFQKALHRLPPGGTGDCCAPKLLQYAYCHNLTPLCMAEFWVGCSPLGEVRHHGHYYPACRSKCLPLLGFMLQGLDVEDNVLDQQPQDPTLPIVYEDQWLMIVDKPAGMLTVPGKSQGALSVQEIVREQLQNASGPLVVHRLDQGTSGLVLIGKTKEVHKSLQSQFADRRISKTYVALLDGILPNDGGTIDLPLRPDSADRPRQVVDMEHGKRAVTEYRVIERRSDKTLVEFRPFTGRTHQLRVHASHPLGLNCPIVGDMLYGTASTRLFLHAQSLSFTHPVTGETVTATSPCDFSI